MPTRCWSEPATARGRLRRSSSPETSSTCWESAVAPGRGFDPDDDRPGRAQPVAVLAYDYLAESLWRRPGRHRRQRSRQRRAVHGRRRRVPRLLERGARLRQAAVSPHDRGIAVEAARSTHHLLRRRRRTAGGRRDARTGSRRTGPPEPRVRAARRHEATRRHRDRDRVRLAPRPVRFGRAAGRGVGHFRGIAARLAGGVREHRQSAARSCRGARQGDRHPAVARCEPPASGSAVAHRRVRAGAQRQRHRHRHRLRAALRPPPFSWRSDRCVSVPSHGRRRGTRLCPAARRRVGRRVRARTRLVCHAHRRRHRAERTRRTARIEVPAARPAARGAGRPQRRPSRQRRPSDARRRSGRGTSIPALPSTTSPPCRSSCHRARTTMRESVRFSRISPTRCAGSRPMPSTRSASRRGSRLSSGAATRHPFAYRIRHRRKRRCSRTSTFRPTISTSCAFRSWPAATSRHPRRGDLWRSDQRDDGAAVLAERESRSARRSSMGRAEQPRDRRRHARCAHAFDGPCAAVVLSAAPPAAAWYPGS